MRDPNNLAKMVVPNARDSFDHIVTPYTNQGNPTARLRFSVTLLVPKSDIATKQEMDDCMAAAYEDGVERLWKGARPQLKNAIVYDGDGTRPNGFPFGPECAGKWVLTASSTYKPGAFDLNGQPLPPDAIYSGMYIAAGIHFYPYSHGNQGIACGLDYIIKLSDGERLSGSGPSNAEVSNVISQLRVTQELRVDPITGEVLR